jgi:hypothetical protein
MRERGCLLPLDASNGHHTEHVSSRLEGVAALFVNLSAASNISQLMSRL